MTFRICILIQIFYWSLVLIHFTIIADSFFGLSLIFEKPNSVYEIFLLFLGSILCMILSKTLIIDLRISKFIYLYIYTSIFIPSIIFIATSDQDLLKIFLNSFIMFMAICFLNVAFLLKPICISINSSLRISFILAFIAFIFFMILYLFGTGSINFNNFHFFDIHLKRDALRDEFQSGTGGFKFYFANWIGFAIAPSIAAYACVKQRWYLLAIAIILGLLAFAVNSQKSAFFLTIIVVCIYFLNMAISRRNIEVSTIKLFIVFLILFFYAPFFIDKIFFDQPIVSFLTTFRLFINNGYLTDAYLEFFADKPFLYYADSFLRGIVSSPFHDTYSRMVGDYVSRYAGQNNANANLFADGFVNLGYFGMLLAALQCAVLMWLIDCVSMNRNPVIVLLVIIPLSFSISNVPVHTSLLSNGGVFQLFFLLMLPKDQSIPTRWVPGRFQTRR